MKNPLSDTPSSIEWIQTLELGYDEPEVRSSICFGCGYAPTIAAAAAATATNSTNNKSSPIWNATITTETPLALSKCAKCHIATYCSRECQIQDWKQGRHKMACSSYARLASLSTTKTKDAISDDDSDNNKNHKDTTAITNTNHQTRRESITAQIRTEWFHRIRFYACPYAVHKAATLGRGFLFLQSDTTLNDLSLAIPKDCSGRPMPVRSILMHYLTLGEYDAEVCRDDFEVALVRSHLQSAVEQYNPDQEVIMLWRLRCGHVALGKAELVPNHTICRKLGHDYYADSSPASGAVQLNLDDM